jgi:hypothetical protein
MFQLLATSRWGSHRLGYAFRTRAHALRLAAKLNAYGGYRYSVVPLSVYGEAAPCTP